MTSFRILQMGNEFKIEVKKNSKWVSISFYGKGSAVEAVDNDEDDWITRFDSEDEAVEGAKQAWGMSGHRVREWRVV